MKHYKNDLTGNIHSVETFGTFDGPGVRYVLFLQGCPLQCKFCHNRDSWSIKTNRLLSVQNILDDFETYRPFYNNGGLTVSGGEPLMQPAFLDALFKQAKTRNIHTTLDTSAGNFNPNTPSRVTSILKHTDLVMLDFKHIDSNEHKALTGKSNANIIEFLNLLESLNQPTIIRHVLIPTINDDEFTIKRMHDFLSTYQCVKGIEVLPYHTSGKQKWKAMGLAYPLEGIPPMDKNTAKTVEARLNKPLTTPKNFKPDETAY